MQDRGSQTNQRASKARNSRSDERTSVAVEPLRFSSDQSALVGGSDVIAGIINRVRQIADTDLSILITGPTGSGKEVVARLIHNSSRRSGKSFVPLNCAAIPDALLESELFG